MTPNILMAQAKSAKRLNRKFGFCRYAIPFLALLAATELLTGWLSAILKLTLMGLTSVMDSVFSLLYAAGVDGSAPPFVSGLLFSVFLLLASVSLGQYAMHCQLTARALGEQYGRKSVSEADARDFNSWLFRKKAVIRVTVAVIAFGIVVWSFSVALAKDQTSYLFLMIPYALMSRTVAVARYNSLMENFSIRSAGWDFRATLVAQICASPTVLNLPVTPQATYEMDNEAAEAQKRITSSTGQVAIRKLIDSGLMPDTNPALQKLTEACFSAYPDADTRFQRKAYKDLVHIKLQRERLEDV